jgi:hypothetical protein
MARERVQVQGLGGAVPGISPTIQRAGQYSVQVQRAGRNKLMDLADALGEVNPLLQQYTRVADLEFEQFQEEMAGKSLEEQQAMLKQTEGELDKQVRRGGMGWLTSPLNQKRKLKAVGALMHDEYERELKSRVENPANADANIDDLINESKDTLRQKYDSLGGVFVNDGFEGAIRDTTRRYTLAHDSLSTTQARQELKLAGKSVLYNASLLDQQGGLANIPAIDDWWETNEGALNPTDLFKLIEDVALTHAVNGNEEAAEQWLDYAAGHLRVGTTKMGTDPESSIDDVFGEYGAEEARIRQRVAEVSERRVSKDKGDAALLLQETEADVVSAMLAISKGKSFEIEDTVLRTEQEVKDYFINKLQQSGNVYARGSDGIKVINTAMSLTSEDENVVRFKQIHEQRVTGASSYRNQIKYTADRIASLPTNVIQDDLTGKSQIDPTIFSKSEELKIKYSQLRDQKFLELSTGSYRNVKGDKVDSTKWQTEVSEDMEAWDQQFIQDYENELNGFITEYKSEQKASAIVSGQKNVEAAKKSLIDPTRDLEEAIPLVGKTFFDIEEKLLEGDFKSANKIAKDLERSEFTVRTANNIYGQSSLYENPVEGAVNTIQSTATTKQQKEIAQRSLVMYLMAKGEDVYNLENIKNGKYLLRIPRVTRRTTYKQATQQGQKIIGGRIGAYGVGAIIETRPARELEIPIDKEAVKDLVGIYPVIAKERLSEIEAGRVEDYSPELELYNSIFGTSLDESDQEKIKEFINLNGKLGKKFYK